MEAFDPVRQVQPEAGPAIRRFDYRLGADLGLAVVISGTVVTTGMAATRYLNMRHLKEHKKQALAAFSEAA